MLLESTSLMLKLQASGCLQEYSEHTAYILCVYSIYRTSMSKLAVSMQGPDENRGSLSLFCHEPSTREYTQYSRVDTVMFSICEFVVVYVNV